MEPDAMATLRHALANPLAALLAEIQLLRLEPNLSTEVSEALERVEGLAIRIRALLRQT